MVKRRWWHSRSRSLGAKARAGGEYTGRVSCGGVGSRTREAPRVRTRRRGTVDARQLPSRNLQWVPEMAVWSPEYPLVIVGGENTARTARS